MSQPDEICDVSRNQEMYDSMGYLKNKLSDTDILQEYFIPQARMPEFVDGLRTIVKKNGANLLNCTIRIAHKDTITSLPYAKEDMFAFVLYFNQKLNTTDSQKLQKATTDLIDLATSLSGTYYLPYQLYYSPEQLRKAYPEVDAFFARKKIYDPEILFTNKWYEKYSASPR
jgi:FAD/FMN-containing dehydrogenase